MFTITDIYQSLYNITRGNHFDRTSCYAVGDCSATCDVYVTGAGEHSSSLRGEAQQRVSGVPVQPLFDGVPLGDGVALARARPSPRRRPAVPLSVLSRGFHRRHGAGGARRHAQQAVLLPGLRRIVPRRVSARPTPGDASPMSGRRAAAAARLAAALPTRLSAAGSSRCRG